MQRSEGVGPMSKKVAVFWPGDYRSKPNEWALPQARETTAQLVAALTKLGRSPYVVDGFLTRPDQAIAKLGPIDDPMVGVFVHWAYAPHTVDGVVGKDNPLLLASNFSGTWPGLVALLNTGASLESVGRHASRAWTDAPDWTARRPVHGAARRVVLDRQDRLRRVRASPGRAGRPGGRGDRGSGLRGDQAQAGAGPDARRHVDGDDQRLLRPEAALPDRLRRAQGRPGLAGRPRAVDRPEQGRGGVRVREGQRRSVPLGRARGRGLHARGHQGPASGLPRGARPARRVPGRLPGLAIPARPLEPAAAERLLRRACSTRTPGPRGMARWSSPAPRPTRGTSCRWS